MTPAAALNSPATIRERCGNITQAVVAGRSANFRVDRAKLAPAAEFVAAVTRRRYPDLAVPYHSRWRHFEAGGIDRSGELDRALAGRSVAERARAQVDLTVVSVLLDAGAGPRWSYVERETGQRYTRSEGLGVASFRAFMAGTFSVRAGDPLRVDASALAMIDGARLATWFQAGGANPLVGADTRAALLRRLGEALGPRGRPSDVFDQLAAGGQKSITSAELLAALLERFNAIWLTGQTLDGEALGDVWPHPFAGGAGPTAGRVPFHKLTQWLAYSLIEPFERAGVAVTGEALTPLPEYRNGGLLLDAGVLQLADPDAASAVHAVGSETVVEWRALTVALLEELAPLVRANLGVPGMPLACILEGGTWAAGRELATRLRGGNPPLTIASDGTVF